MTAPRTFLAILISLAVAVLPATGGFAAVADLSGGPAVAAPAHADCCEHADHPCDKAKDDCCAMAVCAIKCFNFCGSAISAALAALHGTAIGPAPTSEWFRSRPVTPPFRPPRA
jgi:hypothetical protein